MESAPEIHEIPFDDPQSLFIKDVQNPTDVDLVLVQRMASIMCTSDEIAVILGIPPRIFKEHELYAAAYERGRTSGYANLRRAQWGLAIRGNPILQIFLGKQYLGQSDKPQSSSEDDAAIDAQAFESFTKKLSAVMNGKPGDTPKTIEVDGKQYYKKNNKRKYTHKERVRMKAETKVKAAMPPVPEEAVAQRKKELGEAPLLEQMQFDATPTEPDPKAEALREKRRKGLAKAREARAKKLAAQSLPQHDGGTT